jgi:hypothetical protein
MTRLGGLALVTAMAMAGASGWACDLGSCAVECAGGFQLDLRVDATDSDPITLDIQSENSRTTWRCDPGNNRCTRESLVDGDRDFDVQLTMAAATLPFNGLPCDASACIRIQIRGEDEEAGDEGTYGPESVVVAIIGEDGEEFSQDYATEGYGGEDCGYCDSLEAFDERASVD